MPLRHGQPANIGKFSVLQGTFKTSSDGAKRRQGRRGAARGGRRDHKRIRGVSAAAYASWLPPKTSQKGAKQGLKSRFKWQKIAVPRN